MWTYPSFGLNSIGTLNGKECPSKPNSKVKFNNRKLKAKSGTQQEYNSFF